MGHYLAQSHHRNPEGSVAETGARQIDTATGSSSEVKFKQELEAP